MLILFGIGGIIFGVKVYHNQNFVQSVILFQGQPINQMQILDCLVYQSGISILSIVPIIIGIIILVIGI